MAEHLVLALKYCGRRTPRRQISGKDWDAGANILQSLNRARVRCNTDTNVNGKIKLHIPTADEMTALNQ